MTTPLDDHLSAANPVAPEHETAPTDAALITAILLHLQAQTGHDFSHYKASTLLRRISRRMAVNEISELSAYLAHLRADPAEAPALLNECLIGVTEFFRDANAFATLASTIIPSIVRSKSSGEPVRAWVVGCATGEEAYSLAMLLSEATTGLLTPPPIQVFATDIDEEGLAFARRGLYPAAIAEQVSAERLQRFFTQEKEGYRVKLELREQVLFAVHNLLRDPPFSNLDLLCCRNVLIYFEREAQEKSFDLFHYALRPEGYLFVGTSESADSAPTLFAAIDKRHHLYQRRATTGGRVRRLPPTLVSGARTLPTTQPPAPTPRTVHESYQAWTLRRYAPPRLLVNEAYEIVHLFNGAGRYLIEPDGLPTQNLLHKVLPALRLDLRAALYQAFQKNERTESRLLSVEIEGQHGFIQLQVGPVSEADFPQELIEVVFLEHKAEIVLGAANQEMTPIVESELVARLEEELQRTRERMRTILEEHESSIQELRAANEELQSVNEELKSTTEELETSKEELQSMNEELVTVNSELKLKIEEVSRANSDLLNLMASTNVGVIFLDPLLQVKRFTPPATELFYLIESDLGRPFHHIAHRIRRRATTERAQARPVEMAQQVRTTAQQVEEVVQGDNDRWYILRLFPYRTVNNATDGVVITLIDITDWQRAEHELQQRLQQQTVADLGRQALAEADSAALIDSATAQLRARLGVELSGVFALQADGALLLQAGVGWQPAALGQARATMDSNFPIWQALRADQPVILGLRAGETAFSGSPLLVDHGIRSGLSVTIGGRARPYGVLGVYSTQAHHFTQYDIDFLQAVANLLGEAFWRQATAAALRQANSRFERAERAANGFVFESDLRTGQVVRSPNFAAMTGYGLAEVPPTAAGWLQVIHPDDQAQFAQVDFFANDRTSYTGEYRVRHKAGHYFWVQEQGIIERDESGRPVAIVGTTLDITARKAVEEELESYAATLARINNELQQSNQELDDFADAVAHDLREPLRGIRHYATYLLEDYGSRLDAEGLEMVQTLSYLSRRIDTRIGALLDYTRLGRQPVTPHPVDLAPLLVEVLETLHPHITAAAVTVRVPQPLPVAQGDPLLLTELFTNLITNAIQYNDKAEKWVEIGWLTGPETEDRETRDELIPPPQPDRLSSGLVSRVSLSPVFYVRDNGIGIAPEHQQDIFQLFRRLHGRDDFGGGSGAGLALAKRIVGCHQGRIWVASQPGAGATFYFTLGQ